MQAQLHKGDSLYALGNYNDAIKAYTIAEKAEFKIAKSYEALGNTTKALSYYDKGIANGDQSLLTRYNYGKLLLKANRLKKADSLFESLVKESPKNPEFIYRSGLVKEALNDSIAIFKFMYVAVLDSTHLNAQYKLAKHFTVQRNTLAAKRYIDIGLRQDPTSVRFINLNALAYFNSKNYHEAIKQYEQLIALNQSNKQIHNNLAISYARTNQFLKAITQYKILIKRFDDRNPSYHFNLGKMYQAEKEHQLAIASINQAIALQDIPLDKQYLTLATIYKNLGDYKNTFIMIESAVSENPDNEMLRYQYAVAADNYFKDEKSVIKLYEAYLERFGETARFGDLVRQRIVDMKTTEHFENKE